ncbi:MAG: HEAT repeat domain-containing protein [Acidobacteria bacterium]|nr:HEAT repeat domain-containing protein [Acidobacteriota bacterium]MBI3424866.1 HEAT repeat domain-containing protein [Acidobacteriota bacterium]
MKYFVSRLYAAMPPDVRKVSDLPVRGTFLLGLRPFLLSGLLALLCSSAALAQFSKTPTLYEQCEAVAENAANTTAIAKATAELKSTDAKKRIEAVQALTKSCDPRVNDTLLGLLQDADATLRVAAVEALGKLGNQDAIDPLIEALLADKDWRVRAALGLSLGSFNVHRARNATLNVLVNTGNVKVTDEGDMRARCFGILVVNQMRDVRFSRKAISFLFEFVDHDDLKLRQIAEATAVELQHTRNGVHELIGILQQHNFPDYRRKAAYWLGEWHTAEARAALEQTALGDRDSSVQQTAKAALAKLK